VYKTLTLSSSTEGQLPAVLPGAIGATGHRLARRHSRRKIVSASLTTSLQESNFTLLSRVRDDARRDLITATFRWGVPREMLERIADMTPERLLQLVASLGDEAVFVLRSDFTNIIDLPADVARVYAASTTRRPAGTPNSGGHRGHSRTS
jgi:hypothetical protein